MNGRARFLAALNGDSTDHTPVWFLFPYHQTSYYADVRSLPKWAEICAASWRRAITLNRRNLGAPLFTDDVRTGSGSEERDGGARVTKTFIERGNIRLFSETIVSAGETSVKKLLETEEDLEHFCGLPVNNDRDAIQRCLDKQLQNYRREKEEFPMELGAMMLDLGEPVSPLYHSSKLEEFSVWSVTHGDLIKSFLDRAMERCRIIYSYCLERGLADVYFMVGSELAAPPLVSRETFRKWIVPYASELVSMARSYGAKVIQHFHGRIKDILPYFLEMGADALHTIEAPPVGNCTMSEAYSVTGDRMALIGNIQYDDFYRWDKDRMRSEVVRLLDECRGKRFILSPTAGPYDPAPPERVFENYKIMLDTAWDYQWR
jgi:uroporphyrinogen-III decarboxylase